MQAYNLTPPVELRLSAAQPSFCNILPCSIVQAPYYIQQQMMSNQQNNQQSHGLWNGQSSSQSVSNSSNLQSRQMPQMAFNSLIGQVASLPAAQHGALTQIPNHLSSHQTLSINTNVPQQNYNVASMNNVSSTSVYWFPSNYGNENSTINQINLADQSVLLLNGQHNRMHLAQQTAAQPQLAALSGQAQAPQIIHSNQGQTSGGHTNGASYNTVNQYPVTLQKLNPSRPSNYSCPTGQSHSIYNGNQVQHSSQTPHQPSPYRMENNAASYCHLKHRSLTSNQPSPPPYIGQHFAIQNQNRRINQSAESGLPRDSAQPQTPLQRSLHHHKPSHSTVAAFQGNTQSHALKLNHTTPRLQMSSQVTISSSTPTSKAPPPTFTESILNYSKVTSTGLLVDGTQVPSQRHGTIPLSCHKASFTTQGQQPSHNSTKGSYSEKPKSASYCSAPATLCGKKIQLVGKYRTTVQRTAISKENVHVQNSPFKALYVQSSEGLQSILHTDTNPERLNGHKCNNGHGEVQYCEDIAETLELIKALAKVHQQSHKVVAVVPPISQQVPSLENKDVTTSSDDSLPFKIDAVGTIVEEGKNVEHGTNALNLPKETFKKLQQLFSEPHPKTKDFEKHDGSAVNCLISDTRCTDISQSETGSTTPEGAGCSTVLTSNTPEDHTNVNTGHLNCSTVDLQQLFSVPHPEMQDCKQEDGSTIDSLISDTHSTDIPQSNIGSTTSQSPGCFTVSTSETPEDHSNGQTGQSNCDIVDLSKLQVYNFTWKKFNDWVKVLESKVNILSVEDLEKCFVDLYYDGNKSNIEKQVRALTADLSGFFSKVTIEDMQTAKFQYIHPKDLKTLAHGYHILKNDPILSTEEFKSSWLNVDGQPADIENVLAEPILDLNFTDYALEAGFNTQLLNIYLESEPSTKVIPAAADNQNGQMINNELASLQVCQSKSIHQTFGAHKLSEKYEDENMEEPKEQNGHLNSETVGTLAENKRTECEQACRDYEDTEDISSAPEITEQSDLPNEDNSSNDSEFMELSLLSSTDVRKIFNELPGCNLKKEISQLCQDETKVSANVDLGESNDFCNSDNQIKFTCPHVTDIDWNGEHFCPRCWKETPVLYLDLEEGLFSPEEGPPSSTQGHQDQSCSPISGSPDSNCIVLSESNSKTASLNSKSDLFNMNVLEPDLNQVDVVESCTSLSGKSPVKEPYDSLSFTMALEKQVSNTTDSMVAPPEALSDAQNIENPFISVQTKSPIDEVSPPDNRLHKKLGLSKSTKKPVEDDLVTTYMVNKKASFKDPHPVYFSITPAEDDQNHKKERKERGDARNSPIKQKSGKPDTTDSTNPSSGESSSTLSGTSPGKEAHGRVHSESFELITPIEEQVCEPNRISETELFRAVAHTYNTDKRKPVIPSQTTALRRKNPLPNYPPCKKVKVTPVPTADDLFTPDIMVKKASSPKSHPRVPDVTPTKNGRHPFSKDERKEKGGEKRSPVILTLHRHSHSSQSKTDAPKKFKTQFVDNKREFGHTKETGQNEEMKKQRFALYGSKNDNRNRADLHECCNKSKLSTAPVYITVSDRSETTPSYTDTASAKQKVYSQWSSTFVATKPKTSSHKKCRKNVKRMLESKMEALKKRIKDRSALKEKQLQKGSKNI